MKGLEPLDVALGDTPLRHLALAVVHAVPVRDAREGAVRVDDNGAQRVEDDGLPGAHVERDQIRDVLGRRQREHRGRRSRRRIGSWRRRLLSDLAQALRHRRYQFRLKRLAERRAALHAELIVELL